MFAALVNALYFAGLALLIGAVTLRYLVMTRCGMALSERQPALRDATKYGAVGAAAVLVAAPARAMLQAAALAFPGDPFWPGVIQVVSTTDLGRALQLQAIWAGAALMALTAARFGRQRGWSAAAIATMVLALGPALTGHAATAEARLPAQVAATAHVLGAGAWLGTVFHLWRIARKASALTLGRLLGAFHGVALGSAAAVAVTGAYQVWTLVESPADLVADTWGRLLLVKLALLGGVLTLGYRHWRGAQAMVDSGARDALRASLGRELALAVALIAVTGALVAAQR